MNVISSIHLDFYKVNVYYSFTCKAAVPSPFDTLKKVFDARPASAAAVAVSGYVTMSQGIIAPKPPTPSVISKPLSPIVNSLESPVPVVPFSKLGLILTSLSPTIISVES